MSDDKEKERIRILLAEYATLRAEVIQRIWWQMQIITVSGTAVVAIFGYLIAGHVVGGVVLLGLIAISLTLGLAAIDKDTRVIAAHLRALENRINGLAAEALLTWETRNGILAAGIWERFRRVLAGS